MATSLPSEGTTRCRTPLPQGKDQFFASRRAIEWPARQRVRDRAGVQRTKFGTNEFGNYESARSGRRSEEWRQRRQGGVRWVTTGRKPRCRTCSGVARYTTNGSLDSTFHGGGKGTHNLPNNDEDFPGEVILESDDGMLVQINTYGGTRVHRRASERQRCARHQLGQRWNDDARLAGRAFGMAQSGRYLLVVGAAQPGQVAVAIGADRALLAALKRGRAAQPSFG